jgi:uncharacterized protein YecE (DUF72 family)
MQASLFPELGAAIRPAPAAAEHAALSAALPEALRLGTSSWTYPGWRGLVWARDHTENQLAEHGLAAYAQHPLLRAVGVDRTFYRPLTAAQYAAYAAQVPEDFRFVVKAPAVVTDAMVRDVSGSGLRPTPHFLDPALAATACAEPAIAGLGARLGVLVFQLSPLPPAQLLRLPALLHRLGAMLRALPTMGEAIVAVEARNPEFVTPAFAEVLREAGATCCLCLHPKMPPIEAQLPLLRALWPGPLVCRWNLHRRHGSFGYEEASALYSPFDRLQDPDPETRRALARVIAGTTGAGQRAYVTVSNKAEGSAPLSVAALAQAVVEARNG